ncbi:MAG: hydrolase [Butyricicoccaceae bacterium]
MRILKDNCIALVIDYQEKLIPAMSGIDSLLSRSEILLKGLNALEVPMLISQQYPRGLGQTLPQVLEASGNAPTMDKNSFSLWDDDAIRSAVEASGKKTVIICGVEAHVCVLQTAVDLIEAGYQVVLVDDCISSRRPGDKEIAMKRAMHEGATLTTSEAILFELQRISGTPTFKIISKLVK